MSTFANSEDPDEMQHNAAFHQGLHCLQRSMLHFIRVFLGVGGNLGVILVLVCEPVLKKISEDSMRRQNPLCWPIIFCLNCVAFTE